ncbi:MAG: glycosyl hydrolase family 5 [Methylophaga sp.]|nr:MAG: glycosyl hydrolase family 5 [Methylophaga sp.]
MKKRLSLFFLLFFACYSYSLFAVSWQIEPKNKGALFTLNHQSVPIVSADFIGWAANWKWADTKIRSQINNDIQGFKGSVNRLDLKLTGHTSSDKNKQHWQYKIMASKNHPDAIGYGIRFKLKIDSASFEGLAKSPELLSNNTGWRWQISPTEIIELHFSSNISKIHFEKGKKNELRVLFFGPIKRGTYQFDMQLNLVSTSNISLTKKTVVLKDNLEDWYKDQIPWNSSPVDISFLNSSHKPAGKHGFLKADGDALVFDDGTPARFWGANIQASALFKTTNSNIKKQAKRLSRMGFNLVRIHHHDSEWVKPNVFKFSSPKNTLVLNDSSLKKLDWWIKCLEDEGIYIWLDLQVGRAYTAKDGIDNFAEIAKDKNTHLLQGFNYYNKSIQQKIMDFNAAYLNHINHFTKLAYKDNPAIVTTLLLNENDLTHHFGSRLLPNKNVPEHNKIYSADVKQASKRLSLNPKQAWRSWEYGDSKVYLNDAEHRYNQKMLQHLHHLGVNNTLVPGNTWGRMSLASLPSLTDGDIIDAHSYGRKGELTFNPRFRAGFISWLGAAQVTNKPLSVTEWNVEWFPVADRFTTPTYMASIAALQGWDSLMIYGYAQYPLNRVGSGHNYSVYNDPAIMAMMPASALLYRQAHVSEAINTYHFRLTEDDFFGKATNPDTSASLRTLVEQSKINIDLPYGSTLPWLQSHEDEMNASYSPRDPAHHIVNDPNIDFIPPNQEAVISDTKELSRNWIKGIQTINTAKSQIISGKIGQQVIDLRDVRFEIDTPSAVIAVQSLDNKPLSDSTKILISKTARSNPIKKKLSAFLSEPVEGKVIIRAKEGLKLYQLTKKGEKLLKSVKYQNNSYEITLSSNQRSPWLLLKK